jgi:hypothetical protein
MAPSDRFTPAYGETPALRPGVNAAGISDFREDGNFRAEFGRLVFPPRIE